YVEESPLGKAEWVVAVSEIVGRRDSGCAVFDDVVERYHEVQSRVQESDSVHPEVMLNVPYADAWFMPSVHNYMVRLIDDAGGRYLYPQNDSNKSMPIDMETAFQLVSQADVWLNVGMLTSLDGLREACPKFTDAQCVTDRQVYNNNRRSTATGGNDFYESAIMHPDLVLRDLIKIFYPEKVDEELVYYQQLK
ncbi:MAG: hypothetical protein NC114_10460, partial [Ruminococcus flavefaciens]|nr:hypothetical protein [Ruminococcus flavefaciens]